MGEVPTSSQARASTSRSTPARVDALITHVNEAWARAPSRRGVAGLPAIVVDTLLGGGRASAARRAADQLDRSLPGWDELAAEAAVDGVRPQMQPPCALLALRPLRRPEGLLRALQCGRGDAESQFWLLVALSGTDTAPVRAAWVGYLRGWLRAEQPRAERAHWFAFLRGFLRGWLTWADFRDCLSHGRVLEVPASRGDYRRALGRLGLWSHPGFVKWYRELVYEAAHQPDAPLVLASAGWVRDFPGQDYLWEALARLAEKPNRWWPLHVLRWVSGVDLGEERAIGQLREFGPTPLCLLSLVRGDLSAMAGQALGVPDHQAAIHWLRTTGPGRGLDLEWAETVLRPWAEALGEPLSLAVGALCSLDPPPDFTGPAEEPQRRRAFVQEWVIPEFDRVLDNLFYVHALRRQHFEVIVEHARNGSPAAVRALSLWPETAEESAPVLFRVSRFGTKLARRAAQEALDALAEQARVGDREQLEKRVDLASAWADAGLEGRPARVWWDVGGYRVRLSVAAGTVQVEAYTGSRRLASLPKRVRQDARYPEIRQARAALAKSYRYFRQRLEEAMVERVEYSGREFAVLLANPVARSLISRLVLLVDGRPFRWTPADPLDESLAPAEITRAAAVSVAHPLDLVRLNALDQWQQRVIDSRTGQPFKQVFREIYLAGEGECDCCARFLGHALVARRAFALLRERGYGPRQGEAIKEWPLLRLRAHLTWAAPEEAAGRQLAAREEAQPVTSGCIWFESEERGRVAVRAVDPVLFSETLRDADLVVSRAAAGELGFTSEETRRMRATLVRYLARALGLTSVYVGEDASHVIVEGTRATYRVNLGSGSVLLEESRRHLDLGAVRNEAMETLIAESADSLTARVIGVIGALSQDDQIDDPCFLGQLGSAGA